MEKSPNTGTYVQLVQRRQQNAVAGGENLEHELMREMDIALFFLRELPSRWLRVVKNLYAPSIAVEALELIFRYFLRVAIPGEHLR